MLSLFTIVSSLPVHWRAECAHNLYMNTRLDLLTKMLIYLLVIFLFFYNFLGLTRSRRKSLLTSFYKSVVGSLFPFSHLSEELSECVDLDIIHDAMESYHCAADHKAYALRNETHQLFLLFASNVPTYALRWELTTK